MMWQKTKCLILVVMALSAANVYSQKKLSKSGRPVFSSVYTDSSNGRSCRQIEEEFIGCKPVGGYRIFAGYHNVLERIWIETLSGEEVTDIPSNQQRGISRSIGKFEWRLANGKPFAVIARFVFYTLEDVEANRDLTEDKSKFPQFLVIRGLNGFEHIDFEIDTKSTPNSNQKARDLADAGYRRNQ